MWPSSSEKNKICRSLRCTHLLSLWSMHICEGAEKWEKKLEKLQQAMSCKLATSWTGALTRDPWWPTVARGCHRDRCCQPDGLRKPAPSTPVSWPLSPGQPEAIVWTRHVAKQGGKELKLECRKGPGWYPEGSPRGCQFFPLPLKGNRWDIRPSWKDTECQWAARHLTLVTWLRAFLFLAWEVLVNGQQFMETKWQKRGKWGVRGWVGSGRRGHASSREGNL